MIHCAQERVLVTVESASVRPKNGILLGSSANAMTETATNTMASFVQEMVYVAAETVSAGKAGQEMLVKSGLGQITPNNTMKDGKPKDFWFG